MCLKAETTPQMLKRWMSKTVQKKQYSQVADYIRKQMDKDKNKHSPEYYAAQVVRKNGLKLDVKALAKMVRNETVNEDPVKQVRKDIEREKEADKLKHDRLLDRARLARAKQKNRETK